MKRKYLFTGSRDWVDENPLLTLLSLWDPLNTIIIHGKAPGLDMLIDSLARPRGFEIRSYPANWNRYRRAAGPIRNQEILDKEHKPPDDVIHQCFAFPLQASKGTWDMVKRAEQAKIIVEVDRRYL